jgi:phage FluMu gp28-like protein
MSGPIGNGVVSHRDPSDWNEAFKLLQHIEKESDFAIGMLDPKELNNLARGDRKFQWEDYQLAYFDIVGSFITNKPRQSGLSFACAAKYFATSQMSARNFTAVFISYKKEEAISKINYVKQILNALPPTFRKPIIRDPLQMIEWENPANKTRAKLYSHAQKPIRGMTADKILFDEFAFFTMPEILYESAFPALIQTGGTMDIISTPFGLGGMFYDILNDHRKYKDFEKWHIKWWDCMGYIADPSPERWMKIREILDNEDHGMTVEERVRAFGSDRLIKQFENAHSIDSFCQEFEGAFLDGEASFYPKDLIFNSMFDPVSDLERDYAVTDEDVFMEKDEKGKIIKLDAKDALAGINASDMRFLKNKQHFDLEGNVISAEEAFEQLNQGVSGRMDKLGISKNVYDSIISLSNAVHRGEISSNLYAGFDVGRTKNNSCLVILEEIVFGDGTTFQVERYREFMDKWPLPKQQDYLFNLLSSGIIRKMLLDKGGIGWQLSDALTDMFRSQFEGIELGGSAKKKERYMTNLKSRMVNKQIGLLYSKETIDHLYAIKREVQSTGAVVYRADEERKHHSDYAMAVALASLAGTQAGERPKQLFGKTANGTAKALVQEASPIITRSTGLTSLVQNRTSLKQMVQKNGKGSPYRPY